MKTSTFLAAILLVTGTHTAFSAPVTDEAIAAYLEDYRAERLSVGLGDDLTLKEAEDARNRLAAQLPSLLGEHIGYKAAFTNPAIWEQYEVNGPQWGWMFENYIFESGETVSSTLGAVPLFEPDMIAIVKDPALADAESPFEALQHIEAFAPFIELPDAMRASGAVGPALVATNVVFRAGVVGERIDVEPTQQFLDSLAEMTVVTVNETTGEQISEASGSALLGNPAASALWLAQELKAKGIALKVGDVLSLGSFTAPSPTQAGMTVSVTFQGLTDEPSATVHFE